MAQKISLKSRNISFFFNSTFVQKNDHLHVNLSKVGLAYFSLVHEEKMQVDCNIRLIYSFFTIYIPPTICCNVYATRVIIEPKCLCGNLTKF